MIKDEFSRLMSLFAASGEGKSINVERVLAEACVFFEHLNLSIKHGTADEKRDGIKMMNEMHLELLQETKKLTERSGMSEEQLEAFSDNPDNYSEEQWEKKQQAKEKIGLVGIALMESVDALNLPKQEGLKTLLSLPESDKKEVPLKKTKKSNWMRS